MNFDLRRLPGTLSVLLVLSGSFTALAQDPAIPLTITPVVEK